MVPGSVPDSVECRWWNTLSSLEVFPDSSGLEALEPGGLDGIIVAECSVWELFPDPSLFSVLFHRWRRVSVVLIRARPGYFGDLGNEEALVDEVGEGELPQGEGRGCPERRLRAARCLRPHSPADPPVSEAPVPPLLWPLGPS